jgi:hypothetical protein
MQKVAVSLVYPVSLYYNTEDLLLLFFAIALKRCTTVIELVVGWSLCSVESKAVILTVLHASYSHARSSYVAAVCHISQYV